MIDRTAPEPGLLLIGRIGRAHGVRGAVVVHLDSDRTERVSPGARLHDGTGWRTVDQARSQPQHRWVVHFDGIADRTAAEALQGRMLWAEPLTDPDALWVHDLIGRRVVDATGVERGRCVAVLANPAADLLELDTGHLVPTTFVTGLADDQILVDVPDGLWELLD